MIRPAQLFEDRIIPHKGGDGNANRGQSGNDLPCREVEDLIFPSFDYIGDCEIPGQ